jgi:thioredoxin-like negative regulator of GroEL
MKRKIAVVLLFMMLAGCHGGADVKQGTLKWSGDFDHALAAAKDNDGIILLEFSTDWCTYCKYVEDKVFSQKEIADRLGKYILVHLDGDKPEAQPFMDKFKVKGFPTFIAFDSGGKEILRFNDVNSASELMEKLDEVEGKTKAVEGAESSLAEKLNDSNKEHGTAIAKQLIESFPDSPSLPMYYKKLADYYDSETIKRDLLERAAGIIEHRLDSLNGLDDATRRMTLDQHIDLLADIYKDLKRYPKVEEAYVRGARALEDIAKNGGGISKNKYVISVVVYYYLSADKPEDAVDFLDDARDEVPTYWPVYSCYAKAFTRMGKTDKAIEFARKAYGMSEKIAKPRVALTWAEAYASAKAFKGGIDVLRNAESDLLKTGAAESGRAGQMLEQLKGRIAEYEFMSSMAK